MTTLVFYGKPGCASNARQRALLEALGHRLEVRDLLREPWTAQRLRPFFGNVPVADWLNPTAPRVKSGEVVPETLDEAAALALLVADPILIRRPLMVAPWGLCAGFSDPSFLATLGVSLAAGEDLAACSRPDGPTCPTPEVAA